LSGLVEQYPLYSRADEALWMEADSYSRMGPRFRQKAGDALAKIVKDYPLSEYADDARKKLEALEFPVPEPDPAAAARMKYEAENRTRPGMMRRSAGFAMRGPDVSSAAKSGTPTMTNPNKSIPASVPTPGASAGFSGDVTVSPVTGSSALDTNPDARSNPPGSSASSTDANPQQQQDSQQQTDSKSKGKKKKSDKKDNRAAPAANQ
jgi:outer membrane protein assembly factor BamD